jgi:UDP-3-O-[3-hydroxymyristoyl] N-acetylglucosamine deacetylase
LTFQRRTLKAEARLSGRGLHTGVPVELLLTPGDEGIRLRLGGSTWAAIPENVTDTTRSTKVGDIGTVEHFMSAMSGLGITDVDVELTAPEFPALDGSSAEYVRALNEVGFQDIGERASPNLYKRVFVQDDQVSIAISKGAGHWRYEYISGDRWPHEQSYDCLDVKTLYETEIAPARTFAHSADIPAIQANGLAQGLDESSALILEEAGYRQEPRFPDEPARHKLLDLIGDLYLSGVPVQFLNVVAQRSGHRMNVLAALQLKAIIEATPA